MNQALNNINRELLEFIDKSPNQFFVVANMKEELEAAGFTRLYEGESWELEAGRDYYVTRNDSALIAFKIPKISCKSFQIIAAHSDSPLFKIKPNAEITVENSYIKLNVEKYGGLLMAPWFDRPLSVAGRIQVRKERGIESKLVDIDRDLCIIPNLAIHMNRKANDSYSYNAQVDMLPLFAQQDLDFSKKGEVFMELIADWARVDVADIIDSDLYLYDRSRGTILGLNEEFIAAGRLDDLQSCFASFKGFLESRPEDSIAVNVVLDNEEIGSGTKQGAGGTFLSDTLQRIALGLGVSKEDYLKAIASSFLVSVDNAHALHPNHTDKSDPTNRPLLNKGIVIKYSANQAYTTDSTSAAIVKFICEQADIPYQTFVNRSDMAGGSTLGNILQGQLSINAADIGLAQLSMHSPYETAGALDTQYLKEFAKIIFSMSLKSKGDGNFRIDL